MNEYLKFATITALAFHATCSFASPIPAGKCAIIVGASTNKEAAEKLSQKYKTASREFGVIQSNNGFYAAFIGIDDNESGKSLASSLIANGSVPKESYCGNSNRFISISRLDTPEVQQKKPTEEISRTQTTQAASESLAASNQPTSRATQIVKTEKSETIVDGNDICTRFQQSKPLQEISQLAKQHSSRHNIPYKLDTDDELLGQWIYSQLDTTGKPINEQYKKREYINSVEKQINQCISKLQGSDLLYLIVTHGHWLKDLNEKSKVNPQTSVRKIDSSGNIVIESKSTETNSYIDGINFIRQQGASSIITYLNSINKKEITNVIPIWAIVLDPTGKIVNKGFEELRVNFEKRLVALDNAEKQKQVAIASQRAAEMAAERKQKEQKDFEQTPEGQLTLSFQSFQIIQTCYNIRKGYAVVLINDVEHSEAQRKIKLIENALKPKIKTKTVDGIWKDAVARNQSDMVDAVIKSVNVYFSDAKATCNGTYNFLNNLFDRNVGKEAPKKNF